ATTETGTEIYPAITKTGRRTDAPVQLRLHLRPDNWGALLRRTLDYGYANQTARVYARVRGQWRYVGLWRTAGSNVVYFSFPKHETGAPDPVVQTSNRRWRDDEFLIDAKITRG